jgi:hypothetical protein
VSDLQDIIVTSSVKAFNSGLAHGVIQERERIIELLDGNVCDEDFCVHDRCFFTLETIELIQEEQK